MSNPRAKAERSRAKDTRQIPAADTVRTPTKNKRTRPFEVFERWRPPQDWSPQLWGVGPDGWTEWRRVGRYRTPEEAQTAIDHWTRNVRAWEKEFKTVEVSDVP